VIPGGIAPSLPQPTRDRGELRQQPLHPLQSHLYHDALLDRAPEWPGFLQGGLPRLRDRHVAGPPVLSRDDAHPPIPRQWLEGAGERRPRHLLLRGEFTLRQRAPCSRQGRKERVLRRRQLARAQRLVVQLRSGFRYLIGSRFGRHRLWRGRNVYMHLSQN
jgi:hypothetical protein